MRAYITQYLQYAKTPSTATDKSNNLVDSVHICTKKEQECSQTLRLGETQRVQNVNAPDLGAADLDLCCSSI